MQRVDILEQLFDSKVLKILRLFYADEKAEFYLREIAKKTGIAVATTFRIVNKLAKLGIIETIAIKKFKLYKLDDNEHTRFLGQFIRKEKQALQVFITRAKLIEGLQTIVLQDREEKDRAYIILIGANIDQVKVKELCAAIKTEFNFMITELILGEEQFKQMDSMSLFPGKKQVMYQR
ncbi:TPA: winged helix-turn-helix transcriptional regulator [Candidatus Woesearchaeota archaeon]|nr:winged helix-turn-helix transcriptional regulator [Candidatus Woesearchaeota archaeon]